MVLKDCGKTLKNAEFPFYLAVVAANRRFSSKAFKKLVGLKNFWFGSTEEVFEWIGCITGAVPPFGSLMTKPMPTYVDSSLAENEHINFNCGLRTHSIAISYKDYTQVENIETTYQFTEDWLKIHNVLLITNFNQ